MDKLNSLNVYSEIGVLKTVLLHEPGSELENLTPKVLNDLLFDDIPWLPLAIKEHQSFAQILKENGVEVLYLSNLVSESLDTSKEVKLSFIKQFIDDAHIANKSIQNAISKYLLSFKDTLSMVKKTMAGIRKIDIPNYRNQGLSDFLKEFPFITDPIPNLYFTRDPFVIIGNGIAINRMFTDTRNRETIYGEYIFKYHPKYSKENHIDYYNRKGIPHIEGGDILILNDTTIIIGISQRTHPTAIEEIAKNILFDVTTKFEKILAFDIPKFRTFMHLDTVFTQVDYDKFTIHPYCHQNIKIYELTKNVKNQSVIVKSLHKPLQKILSECLNKEVTLIPCGGNDNISSDREQWSDGANTFAIAPGKVIVYDRNYITNEILKSHGITVYTIPSSELSRGRGGPRCMCMPFYRENIK